MPERRGSNARNFVSACSLLNQMLWLKCGAAKGENVQYINGLTAILHGLLRCRNWSDLRANISAF